MKIRWHGKHKHLVQRQTQVNTQYRELSLSVKTGLCQTLGLHMLCKQRNTCIKLVSAFGCCLKYSALITDMSLSYPDYLRIGIWKRDVSAENNLGRKIHTHCAAFSICPPEFIQILPHFLTTLNEVKHNILSASSSQKSDCDYYWTVIKNVHVTVIWGWNEVLKYRRRQPVIRDHWWSLRSERLATGALVITGI